MRKFSLFGMVMETLVDQLVDENDYFCASSGLYNIPHGPLKRG